MFPLLWSKRRGKPRTPISQKLRDWQQNTASRSSKDEATGHTSGMCHESVEQRRTQGQSPSLSLPSQNPVNRLTGKRLQFKQQFDRRHALSLLILRELCLA